MSDQTEGTDLTQDLEGSPIQPSSGAKPDSESSDGQGVDDLVGLILKHPDFQKTLQSTKDKRFAKLDKIETKVDNQDENLARLAKYLGVEAEKVAEAQRQVRYDENMEYIDKLRQGQVTGQTLQGSNVNLSKSYDTLLSSVGLTQAPAGWDDYIGKLDWSDPVSATIQAQKWLSEKANETPQPSPSDKAPPAGGGGDPLNPYPNLTSEELGALYEQLSKHPSKPGNSEKMDKIIAELERRDNKK